LVVDLADIAAQQGLEREIGGELFVVVEDKVVVGFAISAEVFAETGGLVGADGYAGLE
jgi:hypothetical protein